VPFGSERFTVGRGAPVCCARSDLHRPAAAGRAGDLRREPAAGGVDHLNEAAGRHCARSRARTSRSRWRSCCSSGPRRGADGGDDPVELGSRFQITGLDTTQASNDLALLLRAGALAAPMEIIEERTIGPEPGQGQHRPGLLLDAVRLHRDRVFMIATTACSG
jgi:preprotein translocase subunit SecD